MQSLENIEKKVFKIRPFPPLRIFQYLILKENFFKKQIDVLSIFKNFNAAVADLGTGTSASSNVFLSLSSP